jgi:hypothetical protein
MTKSRETLVERHSPADPADAIKAAQTIVARYVPRNRDLVGELIAERLEEAARD